MMGTEMSAMGDSHFWKQLVPLTSLDKVVWVVTLLPQTLLTLTLGS